MSQNISTTPAPNAATAPAPQQQLYPNMGMPMMMQPPMMQQPMPMMMPMMAPPPSYASLTAQQQQQQPVTTTTRFVAPLTTTMTVSGMPEGMTQFSFPQNREIEPMLLLDTTGSMQLPVSAHDKTPRHDVVHEAIGTLVRKLAALDSQSAKEEGGGGLRTVTFAGGKAHDLDDLNPQNLKHKWNKIEWSGSTQIMPGWRKLKHAYKEEFGELSDEKKPIMLALIITDGEASDIEDFEEALETSDKNCYAVVCIVGYGDEHDIAVRSFQKSAKANSRIKVFHCFLHFSLSQPMLCAGDANEVGNRPKCYRQRTAGNDSAMKA
jgi:hypothetical protein